MLIDTTPSRRVRWRIAASQLTPRGWFELVTIADCHTQRTQSLVLCISASNRDSSVSTLDNHKVAVVYLFEYLELSRWNHPPQPTSWILSVAVMKASIRHHLLCLHRAGLTEGKPSRAQRRLDISHSAIRQPLCIRQLMLGCASWRGRRGRFRRRRGGCGGTSRWCGGCRGRGAA